MADGYNSTRLLNFTIIIIADNYILNIKTTERVLEEYKKSFAKKLTCMHDSNVDFKSYLLWVPEGESDLYFDALLFLLMAFTIKLLDNPLQNCKWFQRF